MKIKMTFTKEEYYVFSNIMLNLFRKEAEKEFYQDDDASMVNVYEDKIDGSVHATLAIDEMVSVAILRVYEEYSPKLRALLDAAKILAKAFLPLRAMHKDIAKAVGDALREKRGEKMKAAA